MTRTSFPGSKFCLFGPSTSPPTHPSRTLLLFMLRHTPKLWTMLQTGLTLLSVESLAANRALSSLVSDVMGRGSWCLGSDTGLFELRYLHPLNIWPYNGLRVEQHYLFGSCLCCSCQSTVFVFMLYGCPSIDPHLKRYKTMSEQLSFAVSFSAWTDFL